MLKEPISQNRKDGSSYEEDDMISPALIREELNRILTSRHFRTSRRSKEFLLYVVNQKISGNGDLLKERLLGTQIFGRKPDYATGEDPVVRVQAGDVRRRLERYHADSDNRSEVLIEMPLGSYEPVFRLKRDNQTLESPLSSTAEPVSTGTEHLDATYALPHNVAALSTERPLENGRGATWGSLEVRSGTSDMVPMSGFSKHQPDPQPEAASTPIKRQRNLHRVKRWSATIVIAVGCITIIATMIISTVRKSPNSIVKEFWLPASASSRPVLLCLPKPMVYRPSQKLFDRYRKTHPDAMVTREAREDQFLPLDPGDAIQWGDMIPSRNAGPGIGGVIAAINISKLLTEQNIRFELRFGDEATYAEMRDSPVVVVGGINTYWSTQLTSEMNFVFDENPESPNIHETGGAKRIWKMERSGGVTTRDYGLITRQLLGKSGQFLVQAAGISHFGTEAASDFLVNKIEFAKILASDSINLQKKNLQIVVSTDIVNGRAGPSHVVAVSSW
jgi:hypothetical protein